MQGGEVCYTLQVVHFVHSSLLPVCFASPALLLSPARQRTNTSQHKSKPHKGQQGQSKVMIKSCGAPVWRHRKGKLKPWQQLQRSGVPAPS